MGGGVCLVIVKVKSLQYLSFGAQKLVISVFMSGTLTETNTVSDFKDLKICTGGFILYLCRVIYYFCLFKVSWMTVHCRPLLINLLKKQKIPINISQSPS